MVLVLRLIRLLLLVLPMAAAAQASQFFYDNEGRRAALEIRGRLSTVRTTLLSSDFDPSKATFAHQSSGDIAYSLPSGGDTVARQEILNLRQSLMVLERAAGLKVVPFELVETDNKSIFPPLFGDNELRKEILKLRAEISQLRQTLVARQVRVEEAKGTPPGPVDAQSRLRPCPASGWRHNCFGMYTFFGGNRYVGEWQNAMRFGQGIEYRADGTIYGSGEWANGQLVRSLKLDTNRFPFDGSTPVAGPSADSGRAERERLAAEAEAAQRQQRELEQRQAAERQRQAAEAEAARRKQQELEQKLAAEARERERQTAEAEAARRRQQELEQKLAVDRERERQTAEAEAARRKQQELEQRLATEAEAARLRQKELEQRLTAEAREREKQTAEAEASKRRQQELETQLTAIQSQSNTRPSPQAAVIRNAHALVIGNAAYPGSMRLANPVNDANAISQKLRALGFTVTTVTDMNRQRLVQAMTQFRRSAASADLSLLFYSGHGVQIFGTNYILPTDVDQSDVAQATIQGVRLNEVVENFMPGKTKLVFLDACRDNPLMKTGDRGVSLGLAPVSVAQGTLISYATKDGQTASDGVGSRNSPFTTALLEHLGDPNDIAVVLRKVREKVMQATGGRQQPWEYGSLTGGELVLSAIRPQR